MRKQDNGGRLGSKGALNVRIRSRLKFIASTLFYILSPEVQEVPAVTEHRGHSAGHGELEVLQVDPHGPRHQLGLLGCRHQVDWELEPGLELVTQSDLSVRSFNRFTAFK